MASGSVCPSCENQVRWVRSSNGKWMPIDPEPAPKGNLVIVNGVATVVTKENEAELSTDPLTRERRPRYVSHFTTCPDAHRYRRRTGK